jgi:hypothetical protein
MVVRASHPALCASGSLLTSSSSIITLRYQWKTVSWVFHVGHCVNTHVVCVLTITVSVGNRCLKNECLRGT